MPEKLYRNYFSDKIRTIVHQSIAGPVVTSFSIQLELLVDGYWHKVVRFDSAHGQPHMHIFYPDGKEHKSLMADQDNNKAFTLAGKIMNATYGGYCERYVAYWERMVK